MVSGQLNSVREDLLEDDEGVKLSKDCLAPFCLICGGDLNLVRLSCWAGQTRPALFAAEWRVGGPAKVSPAVHSPPRSHTGHHRRDGSDQSGAACCPAFPCLLCWVGGAERGGEREVELQQRGTRRRATEPALQPCQPSAVYSAATLQKPLAPHKILSFCKSLLPATDQLTNDQIFSSNFLSYFSCFHI